MNTVTVKHRTQDRDVRVPAGPAYSKPSRRPKSRPRVAGERLGVDLSALLTRSLTAHGKTLDPRMAVKVLSMTQLGYSRSIYTEPDGSFASVLPIHWDSMREQA